MSDDVANEEEQVDLKAELNEIANDPPAEPADTPPAEPANETPPLAEPEATPPAEPAAPAAADATPPAEPTPPADPAPAEPSYEDQFYELARSKGYDFKAAGYESVDDFLSKHMQLEQAIPQYQDIHDRYQRIAQYENEIAELERIRAEQRAAPQQPQTQEPQGFRVPTMPSPDDFRRFYLKRSEVDPHTGMEVERWVPRPECPAAYRQQVEEWDAYERSHAERWKTAPVQYLEEMDFIRKSDVEAYVQEQFAAERQRQETWQKANEIADNLPPEYLLGNGNLSPRGVLYANLVNQYDQYYRGQGLVPDPDFISKQARAQEFYSFMQSQQQQPGQPPAQPAATAPTVPAPPAAPAAPAAPAPVAPAAPATPPPSPASSRAPSRRAATENPNAVPDENMSLNDLLIADGTDKELARAASM